MELTLEEQLAVDEYTCAEYAYNNANDNLDEVFKQRLVPLIEAGDFSTAREYIMSMPESVAKLYAADYLRCKRGDYDKS